MSKRARTLLVSGIALLVLGALLAVLLLLPDATGGGTANSTTSTTAQDTSVILVNKDAKTTVSSAVITRSDETFTLVADDKGNLSVKGFDGLPQVTELYDTVADALLGFGAYRKVSDSPKNPADFGFDNKEKPAMSVAIKYSDDTEFAFEIGDLSPAGEGYYFREVGKPTIYLVDTEFAETVTAKSTYYLSTSPLVPPTANNDEDGVVVRDALLYGSVRPQPFEFQISTEIPDDDQNSQILTGYFLTKPYYRNVRSGTDMINASSYHSFVADSVEKVRPTQADLNKAGITNPYSACTTHLTVKKVTTELNKDTGKETSSMSFYNTFKYTLKLGNEISAGVRYAVVYMDDEMVPLLYSVSVASLPWAETQYDDMADELLFFTYIYQVDKMAFTVNNTKTKFHLTHHEDVEDNEAKLTVVANNTQYKTGAFRTLYTELMQITRAGSTDKKPTGTPVLRIDIDTNTSIAHTGWIEFYRYSAGKYTVLHDTGEMHLVDAKDVEDFLALYRRFLNGENIG